MDIKTMERIEANADEREEERERLVYHVCQVQMDVVSFVADLDEDSNPVTVDISIVGEDPADEVARGRMYIFSLRQARRLRDRLSTLIDGL